MKKTEKPIDKPIKAMSWIERVKSALHIFVPTIQHTQKTRVLSSSQVLDERIGRVVTKTEFVPFSNKLSKFKVTDFSIENLQAVGAFDKLKSVTLTANKFTKIDSVAKAFDTITAKQTTNTNLENN